MNVSTMVNFVVVDPVPAAFSGMGINAYINDKALEVIRIVCSHFRFKSTDKDEMTLLKHSHIISKFMRQMLQDKVEAVCGVEILRMDIYEIGFDSAMAS